MNDGRKNVPFAIDEEDDSDVFSSVEVQRAEENLSGGGEVFRSGNSPPTVRSSGPLQAPRASGALQAPPRPVARLVAETVGEPATTVDISQAMFTIGRHGADLKLPDEYVSSMHAMIVQKKHGIHLIDLGSENGVFLRIADDLALEDWDEIAVGSQRFVFRATWDLPAPKANPNAPHTTAMGGNLPADAARLIQVYSGDQVGCVWRISERMTIGRHNADVAEPDDTLLSEMHATIDRRDGKFYIRDANSQSGTFIRVLESVELIDGDVFLLGRTRIKISVP